MFLFIYFKGEVVLIALAETSKHSFLLKLFSVELASGCEVSVDSFPCSFPVSDHGRSGSSRNQSAFYHTKGPGKRARLLPH